MARAEVASASASSDSIKGLAQSIAKPAYRRLLTAEPALRRAVPALIIAFLATICVGAIVQVLDHRRQAISDIIKQIEGSADFLVERLERLEQPKGDKPDRRLQTELERMTPSWARSPGRQILIANGDGIIVAGIRHDLVTNADGTMSASAPLDAGMAGRRLIDVLGPAQPLTTFGAAAGVLEIPLADGSLAYGTVRSLWSNGELAIVHGRADALAAWASDTALTVTLSATTGFVVLILGFAFHWQATRAREADQIYETVRRGQCPGSSRRYRSLRPRRSARRRHRDLGRPCLPHAPCQRQLGVAARPLRTGPAVRRQRAASHRHRRRHHRAEDVGRAHRGS
jgi:two-component system cell cycle sensor histidine kinase PleC